MVTDYFILTKVPELLERLRAEEGYRLVNQNLTNWTNFDI